MIWNMWEHQGWGDSVHFLNWNKRQIAGRLTPLPRAGDEVRVKMESGRVARFEIVDVDYMMGSHGHVLRHGQRPRVEETEK